MIDLTLPYSHGNQLKTLRIYQPAGNASVYHILIDSYYQGTISKLKGEWVAHLNNNSVLTAEDIRILGEKVEQIC